MRTSKQAPAAGRDIFAGAVPFLFPLLLFFAMTGVTSICAVILAALCLILAAGRGPMELLRRRVAPLSAAVAVYGLVCLCAGLWSPFGEYAGEESVKILMALSLFGFVLCRVRTEGLERTLAAADGVIAVISLLCIDAASWTLLSRGFSALLGLTGSVYDPDAIGYETGVRITGIFSNANVSAGVIAFGLVLSLYLYRAAKEERGRLLAALALGTEALAFFLSFSMGAMAAFTVTCLVYVACAGKGRRLSLFLLMLETVLVTLVCAFAAYPFLGRGGAGIVAVALAPLCGAAVWALDRFAGRRLLAALEGRTRAVAVAAGTLAGVVILYALLAFRLTGGVTLTAGSVLSRAVYPDPGAYTVSCEGGDVQVTISSQNESELMMRTSTVLYEGALSEASFTVPEGTRVVWFHLSGEGELESLRLSDGTKVPLDYPLLPDFAANRLQGLWANQNFIQRLVFFRDGIELWSQRPLTGWGLGGVEGRVTAVQSFYYESKYVHNHFIQILAEAGILGLVSFVAMLGCAAWLLIRRRREDDPMLPMLAACLTMMTVHSLTEVVWSARVYQVTVFFLLAVTVIRFHRPAEQRRHALAAGRLSAAVLWGTVLVFALLQAASIYAAGQFARLAGGELSGDPVAILQRIDTLEVYGDTNYKTSLMGNALQEGTTSGRGIAARCARELEATGEFNACYNVAAYYYLPLGQLPAFFQATRTGLQQEASNAAAWDSVFHLYRQAFQQLSSDDMDAFTAGILGTGAALEANNAGRMQPVTLSEENQALLDLARSLESAEPEAAYMAYSLALAE